MQQIGEVYSVPCEETCCLQYVGHTSQALEKRISQHKYSVKIKKGSTGLAQLALEREHTFYFDNTAIFERISYEKTRRVAETPHIKRREESTVNLQNDSDEIASAYDGLLSKLRTNCEW